MSRVLDIRRRAPGGSSRRAISRITHIARHHSATAEGDFASFMRYWRELGWGTGGYHEIILRNGDVQLCYNAGVITNGVRSHNTSTYHICLVGNGSFMAVQEAAWEERARLALRRFGLPVSAVLGHGEFRGASTSCPGIAMRGVRRRLNGGSGGESPASGDAYVRTVQQFVTSQGFGIAIDGLFGPETKAGLVKVLQQELNRRRGVNLVVDGLPGPKTRAQLLVARRGTKGTLTRVVQAFLYAHGSAPGPFDGDFGPKTEAGVKRFQRARRIAVDGVVGPVTWRHLLS